MRLYCPSCKIPLVCAKNGFECETVDGKVRGDLFECRARYPRNTRGCGLRVLVVE